MPHYRQRLILPKLEKKLKFFPVVAIQGARQTGKSYLARELLKKKFPTATYLSFDQASIKGEAKRSPDTFLTEHEDSELLILDEAQKVPEIFDAVKYHVDQKRIPGKYLLLGSTEFSRLTQIRESLTGRMGRIRLFPMTLQETLGLISEKKKIQKKDVLQYLAYGGMPGFFSVRDEEERASLIQDWIDLTCLRDIQQFKDLKLDSDLMYSIVGFTSTLEEPTKAAIAKAVRVDPRRVETHLKVLSELFVLQRLNPHPSGTGKPIYLPLDTAIAGHLGASRLRKLHIWLMNERLAQNAYFDKKRKIFHYYRSTGKKIIHWVEEEPGQKPLAIQLLDHEVIRKTDAELMNAFLAKNENAIGVALAPIAEKQKIKACTFYPWEDLTAFT